MGSRFYRHAVQPAGCSKQYTVPWASLHDMCLPQCWTHRCTADPRKLDQIRQGSRAVMLDRAASRLQGRSVLHGAAGCACGQYTLHMLLVLTGTPCNMCCSTLRISCSTSSESQTMH